MGNAFILSCPNIVKLRIKWIASRKMKFMEWKIFASLFPLSRSADKILSFKLKQKISAAHRLHQVNQIHIEICLRHGGKVIRFYLLSRCDWHENVSELHKFSARRFAGNSMLVKRTDGIRRHVRYDTSQEVFSSIEAHHSDAWHFAFSVAYDCG